MGYVATTTICSTRMIRHDSKHQIVLKLRRQLPSTLIIRRLESSIIIKLKAQADASNRSLEAYLREVVTKATESAPLVLDKGGTSAVRRRPPALPGKVIERGDVLSSEPAALWEPSAGSAA
jgi:hypothetical protein